MLLCCISCSHLLIMSRIIFFLALSHSLPSRVTPRKVAAPLVKGPTYAQLQDSRSSGYHDGLLDQSYGYNEENDYHQYHHYYDDHHHHHHSYQPEQKQPPLPSWVLPLLALVTDWLLDIEKFYNLYFPQVCATPLFFTGTLTVPVRRKRNAASDLPSLTQSALLEKISETSGLYFTDWTNI